MTRDYLTPHPTFLVENGKREFIILTYEEFLAVQERLAGAEDFMTFGRRRKLNKKKAISLSEVKHTLGIR